MGEVTVSTFAFIMGLFALTVALIFRAISTRIVRLRDEIEKLKRLLDRLWEDVQSLKKGSERKELLPAEPPPAPQEKPTPVTPAAHVTEPQPAVVPSPMTLEAVTPSPPTPAPEPRKALSDLESSKEREEAAGKRWPPWMGPVHIAPPITPRAGAAGPPTPAREPRTTLADQEWWKKLEEAAGKRWITWVGAVVLFLCVGLFVKYAFEHRWLGPTARVILGIIAGLAVTAAGERFIRRQMRALGQGLVGAGLAILYVSLYAAYGYYGLLPQPVTFLLMVLVTAVGMALAVAHNAIPISFLAVLGAFLTPVMLRTGVDARDALFSYLLLLDAGVLGVAFFKRWRILDILAFVGTGAYFTGWYFTYYTSDALTPATLWLAAFYVVFLIQPFVFHLRLATPIVGERFFLAVSNAAGMFAWAHAILYPGLKNVLGLVSLGMSASYLALGALTAKRIKTDERAVFGFLALSGMFLTITFPILLDFEGVTIAWAAEAPVLLYLAYKYSYFPVRVGCLIPLVLAAGRIFVIHWPLHETAFTPVSNSDFGTAIFVALAGGAYTLVHYLQRKSSFPADHLLKIWTGVASAFLALILIHVEVWQWLDFSGRAHLRRWAAALVWVAGAAGFLAAGMKLRSFHSRASGFAALSVALFLEGWDYSHGIHPSYFLIFNGRFLAALAGILVLFSYALIYRRSERVCRPDEKRVGISLHGISIGFLVILTSFETSQWLALRGCHYTSRCILPFLWVAAAAGYLASGVRLRSLNLRLVALAALTVAGILAAVGYAYPIEGNYLLCFNWRFAAALTVPLAVFAHAFALRRLRDVCHRAEQFVSEALYGIGIFLLVILVGGETSSWLHIHSRDYLARSLLPLIWMAGAGAYLGAGIRLRLPRLRTAAIVVFSVAAILAARGYRFEMHGGHLLYLNGRFLAALAVVLMIFAHGFVLRRLTNVSLPNERTTAKLLYNIATLLLLILLSVETHLYFLKTVSDPERARWAAQMSLSIVWGVYAAALLAIGFWRKVRSLRLSALGLFGLTALKLVTVDMASVREVYRIASFLVLGLLMIGASYLYHRVEKWLEAASAEKRHAAGEEGVPEHPER